MLRRAVGGQHALVEALLAGRHVQRGVLGEEVHGLQGHLDDLHGHDGEVLDAGHVVDAELDPDDDVLVLDVVLARGEGAHAGAAARLVGVLAAGVELVVAVGGDVDVVVGELGALEVEGGRVGEHLLEGRGVDLVGDGLAVDGVGDRRVLDLEGAVDVVVEVVAAGRGDGRAVHRVADAVGVEVAAGHGVRFLVDEAVAGSVDHGVDAEGKDVLVVGGEDAGMDDGSPWDGEPFVDGLRGEDAGGAHLIHDFSGLVELECEDVLVVCDGDDGLEDELSVADDGCATGSVVGVFPSDPVVLLVDTHDIWHLEDFSLVVVENGREVVD